MNQPTLRPLRYRLAFVCLLVLCALLAASARPCGALAANAPNPQPTLIARWEPCEPDTGVTVIVDDHKLGEGKIYVGCALGQQANGVEALEHAGFHIEGTSAYGLAFICRIDGEPTPAEQTCEQTPGAGAYWTYWHGKPGGRWGYSGCGAASCKPAIGSIEGWGFDAGTNKPAPRIEPMDGSGPHAFALPPVQESSVIPARLAQEWLAPTLNETALQAEEDELAKREELSRRALETLLRGTIALTQAGVKPAELAPVAHWLSRACEEEGVQVGSCGLRELTGKSRYALAILASRALGQDTEDFAGMDLREKLEDTIEATGKVEEGGEPSLLASTVLALARTGALPAKALKTIELLLTKQDPGTGSFEEPTEGQTRVNVEAIEALLAAREQAAVVGEPSLMDKIEAALTKAGENLKRLQEPDGGIRAEGRYEETEPEPKSSEAEPTIESTGMGAVGLALIGHLDNDVMDSEAAQRAAKWVTPYQITAEYAGTGDPETGEHTPAEALIGAFAEEEGALKEALINGIPSSEHGGVYGEAQAPTVYALDALTIAGPYGPYDTSFDQQSLFFESRTVGSPSEPLTATLTNEDVRPLTIASVATAGEQAGDFQLSGGNCAGRTLQPGQSCEAQVGFDPTTSGLREALLRATVQGTGQTMQIPLDGTGTPAPEKTPPAQKATENQPAGESQSPSVLQVQTPHLDDLGASHGLVGVSWRILEAGPGLKSWTISSEPIGVSGARYMTRASGTGTTATSTLLKLPAGHVYELRATFTDADEHATSVQIGRVVVPLDDRWQGLRYSSRWQRIKQAGAWLGTITRGVKGAQASARLAAGRPVFMLRRTSTAASVEVRCGSQRQVFAIAKGPGSIVRQITAAKRSKAGTVSLRVLEGTVDLDGVAVES